jgi:hypothetical protein
MTKDLPMDQNAPKIAVAAIVDTGAIRFGAGMRRAALALPATAVPPASVADTGRIRLGAGMRRSRRQG